MNRTSLAQAKATGISMGTKPQGEDSLGELGDALTGRRPPKAGVFVCLFFCLVFCFLKENLARYPMGRKALECAAGTLPKTKAVRTQNTCDWAMLLTVCPELQPQ